MYSIYMAVYILYILYMEVYNHCIHKQMQIYIYIYIYYLLSLRKKPKTGYYRIINLFPSCFCVSGVNQKHEEIYNKTSSDRIILYIYI